MKLANVIGVLSVVVAIVAAIDFGVLPVLSELAAGTINGRDAAIYFAVLGALAGAGFLVWLAIHTVSRDCS